MTAFDEPRLEKKAQDLEWLLLDVDGVMNDGRIIYDGEGETLKEFNVKDGMGIKTAQRFGLKVGILSGRHSPPLVRRARDLGLDHLITGRADKGKAFDEFLQQTGARPGQVAYVGDDIQDLPILTRCGLSFAPADAVAEVRERVHQVLETPGGRGVVREMVELVLTARGDWRRAVERYLPDA